MAQELPQDLLQRGLALHQRGQLDDAQACYREILGRDPRNVDACHLLGILKAARGEADESLRLLKTAVDGAPKSPMVLMNYGNALRAAGRREEALRAYEAALAVQPTNAPAWLNKGIVLKELDRLEDALASFDRVIALNPNQIEAHQFRGTLSGQLKRFAEALASFDQVLRMKPDHVEALCNRGLALRGLGRLQEALDGFDRAIMLAPAYPDAHNGRGVVLVDLKRFEEALASFDKAIALAPRHAEAHYNRANTLGELRRFEEALAGFDQVIALQPDNAAAHNNRGSMLTALGRLQDALQSYQQALTHDPRLVEALNNCGCTLTELGRPDEACASYEKALAVAPAHRLVLDGLAKAALHACSWKLVQDIKPKLELHIGEGRSLITPFTLLGYHDRPDLQLRAATAYVAGELSNTKASRWQVRLSRRPKLPIAYLSSDFRQHPVAFLMAEMFELHDRDRFEVIGVSWGRDDGSAIRGRICRAFDSLVDVTLRRNDREVAQELRARQIAIAVDLNGLTTSHRIGIFAHGAAPIQVGYLGYPGTTGTSFVDYVVADPIVLPLDQQPYWTERIVHLPVCYLPNDGKRTLPTRPVTRAEFGLPETGFVFCCFNNSWKITPAMFDVWMRLLRDVPGSVLWLMNTSASAERNLRREAEARGVGADRIVFAQRVKEMDLHLARHRLADLCLDTLPYNAHATASDALWMATPFVTCPGVSFSSRVGASLLHDAGLSELICRDLGEYEATARRLAAEPERLKSIKARLEANRLKNALFDSRRRCRALEQAYLTMWEIHQRGESRRAFAVGDAGRITT